MSYPLLLAMSLLVLSVTTASGQGSGDRPASYAFVDVSVIPMDRDGILEHQTVLVDRGSITVVGAVAAVAVPKGTAVIDGRGRYLIPGLGDAHAHLSTPGGGPLLAERALTLFALHGVTMIRSAYTEPHHREALRRVESGELIGPRAELVSPALHGGSAPNPQTARDSVRSYHRQGFRTTKILPGLTRETFDTLVAESKALGMKIAGHIPQGIPLQHALASGYTSVEHLDGYLEAMNPAPGAQSGFFGLGLLGGVDTTRLASLVRATRQAGTVVVPTEFEMELFATVDSGAVHARRPEMRYVAPGLLAAWIRQKDNFARGAGVTSAVASQYASVRRAIIRDLHAAGVPIALGSDGFNLFTVPGPSVFDELGVYVAAGLSTQAALATSTVQVAKLLGLPGVTGTIAMGSVADLVLLEGNPLADISNVRHQAGVMLGGKWLDRAELMRRLEEMVAR
jgi:hypothetical protein